MLHSFVYFALAAAPPMAAVPEPAAPVATVKVGPVALEAAERLLAAMDYDRMLLRTVDQLTAQMRPILKAELEEKVGTVDEELIDRLDAIQTRHVRNRLLNSKDLRRATVALYAAHFTVPELDRMTILMADPAMKRWIEVSPALMRDLMPLLVADSSAGKDELEQEIVKAVTEYVKEKGGKI